MQRYEYVDAVLQSGLSSTAQRVLNVYAAECVWKYGKEVYVAYSVFENKYGIKKRTRDEYVPKLREAGWIRDTGKTAGRGGCNIYELRIPELVQESAPVTDRDISALVRIPGQLVQISGELVQIPVGTSAETCSLNSDTNNDLSSDTNSEEQAPVADAPNAEAPPITEDKEAVNQERVGSPIPKDLGDTGAGPAPVSPSIREKAERELREYDGYKVKEGKDPLTEEEIVKAVDLMVDRGWRKNYKAWVQRASLAWGQVRIGELVW